MPFGNRLTVYISLYDERCYIDKPVCIPLHYGLLLAGERLVDG